ncbi:MAG: rhomboid family intramembrane serine protease [Chloroflexales bacterium]|nr:rhomboid family intramembrane serine protease [Chloroflexales bacterium]
MKQEPHDDDEIEEALRRIREEFGSRRMDDDRSPSAPEPERPVSQPNFEEAEPPNSPFSVRMRLPMDTARVVYILLGLNILIYLITGLLSGNFFTPNAGVLQFLGWKQNDLIAQGQYWRLLTAMFLHGSLLHIFFNGYALYILGPEAERIYGTARFLAVYFLSGLSGSIASYAFSPSPSVGASGAIFGLIGGLAAFYYITRQLLGEFGRRQLQSMIAIIGINLLFGFTMSGIIDNYAHIGGLLGGMLIGWLMAPRFTVDDRLFPPVMVREYLDWSWASALGVFVILALMALLI